MSGLEERTEPVRGKDAGSVVSAPPRRRHRGRLEARPRGVCGAAGHQLC